MNDRELLQRYKDGDGNAFTDFFNRHAESVTRLVASQWDLPLSDIDNAVQIAFIAISRREEIPDDPLAYLYKSALQRAKHIKALKKKPSRTSDLKFESIHEADFDGTSIAGDRKSAQFIAYAPVDEHHLDKFRRLVDQAIGTLPPKEQEVMRELRKNNNSLRGVSRNLKMDFFTARDRRDRAIKKLKTLLA